MKLSKEQAKNNLIKLIERFKKELEAGKIKEYNEEATKIAFIQPLLKDVLGWDIHNRDEVSPEEKISRGRVDYGLKIEGQIKVFVEAKPPKADLNKHIEQAVRYGYNRKGVPFVLLTDFEGFKLFDVTIKPDIRNPKKGLKIDLQWEQYLQEFDKIWLLSRESVLKGELDKLLVLKPKERVPVDKAILDDLKRWREMLAKDIYKNNRNLFHSGDSEKDANYLKEITQRILDRIIFMRFCEDRKFVHRPPLKEVFEGRTESVGTNTMVFLREEFKHYHIIFDSDLFRPQEWENNLLIDFRVMRDIILETYDPYQFDVIPLEILGNIYEQYLGYTIRLTEHQVKYELKPDVRKAGGVYYTPEYIVDYIVKHTVGKMLSELPPSKIKKLRILDPACGSGSFLIRAYEEMLNWYKNQKKNQSRSSHPPLLKGDKGGLIDESEPALTIEEKAKILQEHIFGVDIDEQAVEVTKLSLMLKMLEGEFGILPGRNLLPMLDKNIKCGNSLVSGDAFELMKYFGKDYYKVKPFNWSEEFKQIMVNEGGFDVVIGNPPYITYSLGRGRTKHPKPEVEYICNTYQQSSEYKINSFAVFYERALQLSRPYALCAYIVPGTILINQALSKIRYHLVSNAKLLQIVSLKYKVFPSAEMGDCAILVVQNKKDNNYEIKLNEYTSEIWNKDYHLDKIKSVNILTTPEYRIYMNSFSYDILKIRMRKNMKTLEEIVKFYNGIKTGNNKKFISHTKMSSKHKPVIRGRDFERYSVVNPRVFVLFDSKLLWSNTNEAILGMKNKLIIRQTGDKLIATIDEFGIYCMDTVHMIYQSLYNLKFILGLLNSKFLNYYYLCMIPEFGKTFAEVKIANLKQLPIPMIRYSIASEKKLHDDLVALVDIMLDLNKKLQTARGSEKEQIQKQIEKTDREIDELVYKLYGITDEERKIIEGEK
ncbi:MAG: TaqI-like C-terminal specificity domain-containing protein [candidate division WOR-3 bacterium]